VVVVWPGRAVTEAELLDRCLTRLGRYKVPRAVLFRAGLPLSAAGKTLKKELKIELSNLKETP
jgi:acyl-CoA synthetase (AMP-forming)/AMP-acid ligase II